MPKNLELDGPKESGKQTTLMTSKQLGFLNKNMTRGAQDGKHQKGQILIPRPKPKGEEKKLKHDESNLLVAQQIALKGLITPIVMNCAMAHK
jgi:hypothetical protein